MDLDIHCNVIKCRKKLSIEGQACVTSCSHIFCLDCARTTFDKALVCPACKTQLVEENDDMLLVQLNPTEEYKSSVLAGLKPDSILDICSRAIAFYEYQTSQEIAFKSMLQKNTEEKYRLLKSEFDIVTRDLNHLIKVGKEKQKELLNNYETEKMKSQEIYSKLQEKSKQFQKLQIMYEKLKRQSIGANLQENFTHQPMTADIMRPSHHSYPHQQRFVKSDIISRVGRSSLNQTTRLTPSRNRSSSDLPSTRIPSPVKSIYSVRSHHRRYHANNDTSRKIP